MKIVPIILSGGFGTRLWPLSRQKMPKQFLDNLFDNETLFSKTIKLVSNKDIFLPSIAITHKDHKFFALQQYSHLGIKPSSIILEPYAKNTATAILCACYKIIEIYQNDKVGILVLPSDHLIKSPSLFEESVKNGLEVINKKIITFGVKPNFPSTAYGYIQKSNSISKNCFDINKFVEKPNHDNANKFIKDDNYLWNAGIFLFTADFLIKEAKKYLPQGLSTAKSSINNANQDKIFCEINNNDYKNAEDISIDYAILEKSDNIATTHLKSEWSDVGDFESIHKVKDKDANGNVIKGNVASYDTHNSLIYANNNLIACLGLKNIIAVATDNAILIADKNKAQDIKKITKDLLSKNKDEVKFHNRVFRPWGYYETLSSGIGFKVKRILVNPNSSLSLQSHNFRSEHWVIIKGVATVEKENKISQLLAGESIFIAIKDKHRLSNNTKQDLEIIEVQIGEKTDEDDITRFEDSYGRK